MEPGVGGENGGSGIGGSLWQAGTVSAAGEHAAAVMHEINNPLEAALNLAYLIHEDAEDSYKVRAYVQLLQEQLSAVTAISRKTLSFYKAPATMQKVDLVEVARAALRVHEHRMSLKGVLVARQLSDEAIVLGNSGELLQVISNLVANAMDALPEQGEVTVRVRKGHREAHVVVVDNGCGIAERHLSRIFEPFFTTKQEQGTGLGLAISKSIVERHSGRMRARSSVRKGRTGSAFRISLPLAAAAAEN